MIWYDYFPPRPVQREVREGLRHHRGAESGTDGRAAQVPARERAPGEGEQGDQEGDAAAEGQGISCTQDEEGEIFLIYSIKL